MDAATAIETLGLFSIVELEELVASGDLQASGSRILKRSVAALRDRWRQGRDWRWARLTRKRKGNRNP